MISHVRSFDMIADLLTKSVTGTIFSANVNFLLGSETRTSLVIKQAQRRPNGTMFPSQKEK